MDAAIPIRVGQPSDCAQLATLRYALWPDSSVEDHGRELVPLLAGKAPGIMPLVVFVAEEQGSRLVGFIEVGLRSYGDGCDPKVPVGYVEGWYVSPDQRRKGVGAQLLRAAEDWARGQGCVEMASDTWLDNEVSQNVHMALGFEIVDRCITYRKTL